MKYTDLEKSLIWLNEAQGIQPYKKHELLDNYSDALELRENFASEKELIESVINNGGYNKLAALYDKIDETIAELNRCNVTALTLASDNYPSELRNIDDPPLCIYCLGNIELLTDSRRIGIVGTRRLTRYGKDACKFFTRELSYNGFTVISGMARGADTIAHEVTIENSGRTIAVLGSGLDIIYPSENTELYKHIIASGLVISEYPLGTQPFSYNFPQRNRIISGLSDGILVIEAGEKSGTMITVDFALDQGKEVFAIPGNIFSEQSNGTNRLLKDSKAHMVTNINDILSEFNVKERKLNVTPLQLDFIEQSIIAELDSEDLHFEELLSKSGLEVHKLMSILTKLEMYGIVRKLPGNYYGKVQGVY